MTQTVNRSAFSIIRDRATNYAEMLDHITLSGLITLLDENGDCVRVESTSTYAEYSSTIRPILQKYAHQITDNSKIFWIDGDTRWKTVVRADTVFTIITASEPSTTKE
jgi:hypothetical protein